MKNLKHSRPGWINHPIEFHKYEDESLCVIRHLQEYLNKAN